MLSRPAWGFVAWGWFACLALAFIGGGASVARAQTGAFEGVITEDNAAIRSGGSSSFYIVARLPKGTPVAVQEMESGWYRITPPAQAFSVVEKAAVQASPDGKTATVAAEAAPVYAANIEPDNGSPNPHWRRQVNLARGQTVAIVGEVGKFYRIVAPPGAFVYVAPTALRRVEANAVIPPVAPLPAPTSPKPAAAATPAPTVAAVTPMAPVAPAATQPSAEAAPAPALTTPPAPEPAVTMAPPPTAIPAVPPPAPVVLKPSASPAFVEAEGQFKDAMTLPLEKQPLDALLTMYRALQADRSLLPSERRVLPARIAQIQRNQKLAAGLADLADLKGSIDSAQQTIVSVQVEAKNRKEEIVKSPNRALAYDAVGRLVGSAVYDGQRMPMLYRLLDPAGGRTVAYVLPDEKLLDPKVYLGQVVGIMGEPRFDPALKLNVFQASEVDILEPTTAGK